MSALVKDFLDTDLVPSNNGLSGVVLIEQPYRMLIDGSLSDRLGCSALPVGVVVDQFLLGAAEHRQIGLETIFELAAFPQCIDVCSHESGSLHREAN